MNNEANRLNLLHYNPIEWRPKLQAIQKRGKKKVVIVFKNAQFYVEGRNFKENQHRLCFFPWVIIDLGILKDSTGEFKFNPMGFENYFYDNGFCSIRKQNLEIEKIPMIRKFK